MESFPSVGRDLWSYLLVSFRLSHCLRHWRWTNCIEPEHLHGEMRGFSFSLSSAKQILHMQLGSESASFTSSSTTKGGMISSSIFFSSFIPIPSPRGYGSLRPFTGVAESSSWSAMPPFPSSICGLRLRACVVVYSCGYFYSSYLELLSFSLPSWFAFALLGSKIWFYWLIKN